VGLLLIKEVTIGYKAGVDVDPATPTLVVANGVATDSAVINQLDVTLWVLTTSTLIEFGEGLHHTQRRGCFGEAKLFFGVPHLVCLI
jgi:hypothetical protein